MKRFRKVLSAILSVALLTAVNASAAEYSFSNPVIGFVAIPDDFSACTMDSCDEELDNILTLNKFTSEQWRKEVMEPSGYELYAMNISEGKYIYLACNESDKPETETDEDGYITHRLMNDYKLLDNDSKKSALAELKKALTKQGINANDIEYTDWFKTDDEYGIEYIEYLCYSGSEYFHCYETIYDAAKIELQFTSPTEFSSEEKAAHSEILKSLKYHKIVDYTDAKEAISKNRQTKLEIETHSGENTKLIRTFISASIVLIVIFAVLMAIRSQSIKRRKYIKKIQDEKE